MKSNFLKSGAVLLAVAMASPAMAGRADRRAVRQQERINQGINSGQLNGREAARLEKREAKIDGQIAADRAANGGHLTPAERRQINREQNHTSRAIFNQKHDAQTAGGAESMEVNAREARQQGRIEQGLQSGQLTGKEAAHLENRETRIDAEAARDRAANGGTLTPAEHAKIEREQNRASQAIYNQKHDAQTQPGTAPATP
jgi:hypothetical protein